MNMTYEEWDTTTELFSKIQQDTYWPTSIELEMMEKNPDKYLLYIAYKLETNSEPETKEEEYSKKTMLQILYDNLELEDEEN